MRRAETDQQDTGGPRLTGAAEPEAPSGPTPAERARTLAYGMADGVLVAPGVPYAPVPAHTTDLDGRPLLLLPASSPIVAALAGEPDLPATLRICDVAPVPLADRVRGRAWLHGWLTEIPAAELRAAALRLSRPHPRPELLDLAAPVPPPRGAGGGEADEGSEWTILALEVAQVEIQDAWGSATLEPEEYADAAPDPFVAVEAGMLTHLDSCHRAELAGLLPEPVRPEPGADGSAGAEPRDAVRPLGLDRHGLWLRCRMPCADGSVTCDLRLPFPEPVRDVHGLRHAYRTLFARSTP
ncbi:prephenate dehydratase [Actinomadura cremea]|nr:prephenate dehydratase [Actinomadura cremea]